MRIPPARICFSDQDRAEILQGIDESLKTGQLTLGKNGKQFEEEIARFIGTKHAVVVNSGTSSIQIPMHIYNVRGKEVIVPTNTFFATALGVMHAGGIPRFVDCDPATFSVDMDSLRNAITERTAGVVVVHIGGIVTPHMQEIVDLCTQRGIFLFEDAAHAHGSSFRGKNAGTFGEASSFSFYPTKIITSGEGGVICTDSDRIDQESRLYRDQGKATFTANIHNKLGYNWRMSEPHAIIGMTHFRHLPEFIAERNRLARVYDRALKGTAGLRPLQLAEGTVSNYYKYIAMLDEKIDRARLKKILRETYDVGLSGEVYELPVHLQPIFEGQYKKGDLPKAEHACAHHVCMPLYQKMSEADVEYVATSVKAALGML
jgi:dTDP-4-amino-4,6-dideoxygalactose transaminase